MKVEINGDLITSGFHHVSKAGLRLYVNCRDKTTYLNASSRESDKVTFWFMDDNHTDEYSEIVFHFETAHERELLKDTQGFDCQCKDQFEFLFVKFDDLKEREE